MLFLFISFFLALNSSFAEIVLFQCGGTQFEVKMTVEKQDALYVFVLYGKAHGKMKELYTVDRNHFSTSCVKNRHGKEQLLFSRDCGGSGCVREYGIIDPLSFRFLLRPRTDIENSRTAEKVLGVDLPAKNDFTFSLYSGVETSQPLLPYCIPGHCAEKDGKDGSK